MRHDGCGGQAGKAELLTSIEGVSSRPVRKIRAAGLADGQSPPHAPAMFAITEAEAAAIRAVFERRGEFAAAVELRRRFPGITDNAQAGECVRTIAGWKPLRPARLLRKSRR
jgi:hypothetical protein